MRFAHLHLPGLTRYTHASQLQEALIQSHFRYKDSLRSSTTSTTNSSSNSPPITQPDPTILTFTCHPTYTVGRRYLSSSISNPSSTSPSSSSSSSTSSSPSSKPTYHISAAQQSFLRADNLAAFHATARGGDLTFHGPGQLTVYPVLDLRSVRTAGGDRLTPRAYISLLETAVTRTCARLSVLDTTTTENPGVWIRGGERKICAVGVQVRRGITGHGIALNVRDEEVERGSGYDNHKPEGGKEGGMLNWGFSRIVACGLEGKSVTWLTREGARDDLEVAEVANVFVGEFAKELGGIEEIYHVREEDIMIEDLRRKIEDTDVDD